MGRRKILFFKDEALAYGGASKMLQTIAKHLDPALFEVYFMYDDRNGAPRRSYLENTHVTLIRFEYGEQKSVPPYDYIGMRPDILQVIDQFEIDCVFTILWSSYQFPLTAIPSTVPVVGVSPFGDWSSNGGLFRIYCTGRSSLARALASGARNAQLIFQPIEGPPTELEAKPPPDRTIVFGRIGRPDDRIFDPVSVLAFERLERKYGDRVRYDVVAAPPAMERLVRDRGLRYVRLLPPITDENALWRYYHSIDVLAHARLDGETLGVGIAEAMLAGVPVISHVSRFNNDHIDLLLHPEFARWSGVDDVDGYFENLCWFVENRDKIRDMGRLAREKARSLVSIDGILPGLSADLIEAARVARYRTLWGKPAGLVGVRLASAYFRVKYLGRAAGIAALGGAGTRRWTFARAIARALGQTQRQRMRKTGVLD